MSKIVISSGHGQKVQGAVGIINEVEQARRVVDRLAEELKSRNVEVVTFHDNTSTSQSQNLDTIVKAHNKETRNLDISVHFNAFEYTEDPRGVEVLYKTQHDLAAKLSKAIANAGDLIDRGAKKRTDLKFLNATEEPAVLLEVCFVDSEADCDLYGETFDDICNAIADVLGGTEEEELQPIPPPGTATDVPRVDIHVEGDVMIFVNGTQVGIKG